MAAVVWEFFGYRSTDSSPQALRSARDHLCPYLNNEICEKRLSDGTVAGVCTIKPVTSDPVICCPIRLYAQDYRALRDVADRAFGPGHEFAIGREAKKRVREQGGAVVAVFGKRWGKELRLPQKQGAGGYFVDWVLALLDAEGKLQEFVAVEVQTIDTTGNYRVGREKLLGESREIVKTTAGLNWENVSKRIIPQLIYKGQVLQREELCRKGLFFICPVPVYNRIMARLGGEGGLVPHPLQPASVTFLAYKHDNECKVDPGETVPLVCNPPHSTTVYRLQESFNNVTLPDQNVYRDAILAALGQD